jgi:beta-lactamase regulating signal transducer with metallopeptidase domain
MSHNLFNDQAAKKRRTTDAIAAIFLLLWAVVIFGNLFVCADKTAEIQERKITEATR